MLADKAYDADRIRELIQDQGATPNIPPKSNRRGKPCFSKRLPRAQPYRAVLRKLKHFRRVATRYDKIAANFLAMVQLASMRLWLRAYGSMAYLVASLPHRRQAARGAIDHTEALNDHLLPKLDHAVRG